jgi:hypothetical protein
MREFLKKHSYLIVWVSALIIVGAIAELIVKLNGITLPLPGPGNGTAPASGVPAATPRPPLPAPAPRMTIALQRSKTGNTLWIQWSYLPNGTIRLDILRGRTGTDPQTWPVWKTVTVPIEELLNGTLQIDLGPATENGYSFQIEAIGQGSQGNGTGNGPTNGTSTPQMPILWMSSSTEPMVTTSPPPGAPPATPGNGTGNGTVPVNGEPTTTTPSPSSTSNETPPPAAPAQSPSSSPPVTQSSPSSTTGPVPPGGNQTPSGTPYYTPQVQIETYGSAPTGTFWAENQNQGILIGWNDLPPQTTSITVSRSTTDQGPWNVILVQENPGTSGSYTIQLIDSTIGTPYYYQMAAAQNGGVDLTYGPVYVPTP